MIRTLKLSIVGVLCALSTAHVGAGQTPLLGGVMRDKLEHSQKILEAVVTSDWQSLEQHTRDLRQLINSPGWSVLRTPEYSRRTVAIQRATENLLDAARQHDLEGVSLAYMGLVTSCVECHRSVARSRIAGGS